MSGGLDKTVKIWDLNSCANISNSSDLNKSSGSGSSSTSSNDLFKSINVNFDVYSINKDSQNVFYFSGARKPTKTKIKLNKCVKNEPSNQTEKTQKANAMSSKTHNNNDNNSNSSSLLAHETALAPSTSSGMNTRRRSAVQSNSTKRASSTSSVQLQLPPNSTNYLLDDDDLYEV